MKRQDGLSGKEKFRKKLEILPVRVGYKGSGKRKGHVAIVTGGDSGIGRSAAVDENLPH